MTGGRLAAVRKYVEGDDLVMLTYGDGVADIDIKRLVAFHRSHGKIATVTAVRPPGRFGELSLTGGLVAEFNEKPQAEAGVHQRRLLRLRRAANLGLPQPEPRAACSRTSRCRRWSRDGQLAAYRARRVLATDGHLARVQPSQRALGVGPGALEGLAVSAAASGSTARRW